MAFFVPPKALFEDAAFVAVIQNTPDTKWLQVFEQIFLFIQAYNIKLIINTYHSLSTYGIALTATLSKTLVEEVLKVIETEIHKGTQFLTGNSYSFELNSISV